jgi:uncharacterized protein (TIGR03435 family)
MNRHSWTTRLGPALVVALSVVSLKAQPGSGPAFEVASLRPHPGPAGGILIKLWLPIFQCPPRHNCGILGNRFREEAVSLAELIMDAYKVKKFQIAGLPAWGDSQGNMYDLEAKVEGESPPTVDRVRLMLQAFLSDRFQLRIHHESRLVPVYALVPLKKGVKLIPNKDKALCPVIPGRKEALASLRKRDDSPLPWSFSAEQVAVRAQQPVIDETGLDGDAAYCTDDGADPLLALLFEMSGDRASVFTAVEEKWGMKLESKKAPVDVVVIDKVERPSAN